MRLGIFILLLLVTAVAVGAAPVITLESSSVQDQDKLNSSRYASAPLNVSVDIASKLIYSIDNGSYSELTANGTQASTSTGGIGLHEGGNLITIVAIESDVSNSSIQLTVFLDTQDPTATVSFSPSSASPLAVNVILTWDITDANLASSWISLVDPNGTVITNQTDPDDNYALLASSVVEGNFTADYFAIDDMSNIVMGSIVLQVSNDLPDVTLLNPANNTRTKNRYIEVSCKASDENLTTITLFHDNDQSFQLDQEKQANSSQTIKFNLTSLDSETFLWNCLAKDANGGESWGVNRTIRIDAIEPTISALSPTDGHGTLKKEVTFQWLVSDNYGGQIDCDLMVDGERKKEVNLGSGNDTEFTLSFESGQHQYYVVCTDEVGNNKTTSTRKFTIDTGVESAATVEPPKEEEKKEEADTPEQEDKEAGTEDKVVVKTEPVLLDPQEESPSILSRLAEALGGRFTFRKSLVITGVVVAILLLGLGLLGLREYSKDNIMFRVKMRKWKFNIKKFYHKTIRRKKNYF